VFGSFWEGHIHYTVIKSSSFREAFSFQGMGILGGGLLQFLAAQSLAHSLIS
jgi:hypothetical protein